MGVGRFYSFSRIHHKCLKSVGRFYNPDFGPIFLTTVIGLRARVNPVGMEIAFDPVKVGSAFVVRLFRFPP